jgi:hypothetical protein
MATVDQLNIKIGVDATGAKTELRGVATDVAAVGKAGDTAKAGLTGMTAAGGAAKIALGGVATAAGLVAGAFGAGVALLGEVSERLDGIAKAARAAGTTASDLDTLSGALGLLTDGSADATRLLQALDKQLGKAATGSAEAAQAFGSLGLSADDLAGLSGTAKLALVADRMAALGTDAERAAASARLFEDAGRSMAGVWRDGGDVIREAAERIQDAGVASDDGAAAAEEYRDQIALLTRRLTKLRDEAIAPLLRPAALLLEHFLNSVDALTSGPGGGLSGLYYKLAAGLASVGTAAEVAGIYVESLAKKWRPLALAVTAASLGNWSLAAEAVASVGTVAVDTADAVSDANERLVETLSKLALAQAGVEFKPKRPRGGNGNGNGEVNLLSSSDEVTISDDIALLSGAGETKITDDPEYQREQALTEAIGEEYGKRESYASDYAAAAGSIFNSLAEVVTASTKKQTREQRAALKALFVATKIAALAQVVVNTAQSVSASSAVGFPAAIPGIAAAVATGAASAAAIVAETVSGLVADGGIASSDLRRMGFTGRQTVAVRSDESVLGPQASSDAMRIADSLAVVRAQVERPAPVAQGGGDVYLDGEVVGRLMARSLARGMKLGDATLVTAMRDFDR